MLPILVLSISGIVALFLGFLKSRWILMPLTLLFILAAIVGVLLDKNGMSPYAGAFPTMLSTDNVSIAFSGIILLAALFIVPLSRYYANQENAQPAEYYAILLFSLVGALMMTSYENLIMLFVGLEILSISMYILTGSDKDNLRSGEAALKYFLMGSFATGILLFGVALLYGATGGFDLHMIANYVRNSGNVSPMLYLGLSIVLIGILFKLSIAPFHFWTPDVYDGAPSVFTAFMSTIVKTAGFAALYKILSVSFSDLYGFWWVCLAITTIATLIIGNITAVYQTSFKRMLAYSSISHAGYLLMAVTTFNAYSQKAIIFYSLAYALSTITAFGVLIIVEQTANDKYEAFNGLGKRAPLLAFVNTVAMCSLAGMPLTAGFIGKFFVFTSAADNDMVWIMIVAILMSAVGFYYYFRVIIAMYMRPAVETDVDNVVVIPGIYRTVLMLATLLTILFGLAPDLLTSLF